MRPSSEMDAKDAHSDLESEGGRHAPCHCSSMWKYATAFVFVMQCLFACAVVKLSIVPKQVSKDKGICMQMIVSDSVSDELMFRPFWNQSVHLTTSNRTLKLKCPGPYVVYLWVNMQIFSDSEALLNLTMVQGNKSFPLLTLRNKEYEETQTIVMLSDKSEVLVKAQISGAFKIGNLILGLHYMLGDQCFDT